MKFIWKKFCALVTFHVRVKRSLRVALEGSVSVLNLEREVGLRRISRILVIGMHDVYSGSRSHFLVQIHK